MHSATWLTNYSSLAKKQAIRSLDVIQLRRKKINLEEVLFKVNATEPEGGAQQLKRC